MASVPITDRPTRQLIVAQLFSAYERALGSVELSAAEKKLINLFKGRSMSVVAQAVEQMPSTCFQCAVDLGGFANAIQVVDQQNSEQEDRQYFVIHGASLEMCAAIFRMRAPEYRALREALKDEIDGSGRPRIPTEREGEKIYGDWLQLQTTQAALSIRRRLIALNQLHPNWSMASLWITLQEYRALPSSNLSGQGQNEGRATKPRRKVPGLAS